ncbi:MAG: hypothetical protein ABI791_14645 [Acidobacteriota bacterium]
MSAPVDDPNALAASSFNFLVGVVIGIPVIGLGIIIALMAVMKNGLGFRDDMIFVVIFMTFLLLFIAEIGTLWMMISRTKKPKVKSSTEPAAIAPKAVGEIEPVVMKGLNASTFEGIPSVTEHTTRTLDAAYRQSGDSE